MPYSRQPWDYIRAGTTVAISGANGTTVWTFTPYFAFSGGLIVGIGADITTQVTTNAAGLRVDYTRGGVETTSSSLISIPTTLTANNCAMERNITPIRINQGDIVEIATQHPGTAPGAGSGIVGMFVCFDR